MSPDPPGCINLLDTITEIQADVDRFRDAYNAGDAARAQAVGEDLDNHFFLLDDDDQCLHGATTAQISAAAQQVNFHVDDADLILSLTSFGVDGWPDRLATFMRGGVDFDSTFKGLYQSARDLAHVLACYPNSRSGSSDLSAIANVDPRAQPGCAPAPSPSGAPIYLARDPATFRAWIRAAFDIKLGREPSEDELQRNGDKMAMVHRKHHDRLLSAEPVQRGLVAALLEMFD